ncbi:MAG: hypothetical protein H6729_15915 [Deltaproteobacteria bacterium]|nr:hypothetical protein [Deltaproteobacteria bacterium]
MKFPLVSLLALENWVLQVLFLAWFCALWLATGFGVPEGLRSLAAFAACGIMTAMGALLVATTLVSRLRDAFVCKARYDDFERRSILFISSILVAIGWLQLLRL